MISIGAAPDAADDDIALVTDRETLTFGDMRRRSDRLAADLRGLGVGPDRVVGVACRRSAASVIAAHATLASGGAYLPIDPDQPRERSAFELRDAGASVVISAPNEDWDALAGCSNITVGIGGRRVGEIRGGAGSDAGRVASASAGDADLAYVIYTSGSTGRPKGVEITRGGLANLIAWHRAAFALSPTDRAGHACAVGFDAAVWEIWPYLSSGAAIVIADDFVARDAAAFQAWLIASRLTIAFAPTPLAEQLIGLPWPAQTTLRTLLTGADTLHVFAPADLPFALINNYGPTEATVVATSGRVGRADGAAPGDLPSIGRAIAGVDVVVVDAAGRSVADGEPGELWIGGAGVARGYRNAPELTAQRFVTARFAHSVHQRFYRTGDIGRLRADGTLQFAGRSDEQLKLRGYRIEAAEIEAALNAHPAIRASAVIGRRHAASDTRLTAYIEIAAQQTLPARRDLRAFLAARLPTYMIPAAFVAMTRLPLTARGKVDRAALRARDEREVGALTDPISAARTPTERRLVELVTTLLGNPDFDVDDDLAGAGVHSLLLTKLLARIRDAFGVEVSFRQSVEAPSLGALAAEIERLTEQPASSDAMPIPRRTGHSHR